MVVERHWAMPSHKTFTIGPVAVILARLITDSNGWVDPYSGESTLAGWTNDINPAMPSMTHKDALDFLGGMWTESVSGILLDPPYSARQILEKYNKWGTVKQITPILEEAARVVRPGGLAVSFGWNSNGIGKCRGFTIKEVHLIAHGAQHNDTIVTVEVKDGS